MRMNTITKNPLKLIKNIIISLFIFTLTAVVFASQYKGEMQNPNGDKIKLRFAISKEEHTQGLSGLKSNQFQSNEGMLFINSSTAPRKFWMPDTYFDLDIIFLDTDLKIVGISKKALAHPGMQEPPEIFKTPVFLAHYVLETKHNVKFSKKLKVGDQLKYIGKPSLSEIISNTHPEQ